jgi:hypothetical protein
LLALQLGLNKVAVQHISEWLGHSATIWSVHNRAMIAGTFMSGPFNTVQMLDQCALFIFFK